MKSPTTTSTREAQKHLDAAHSDLNDLFRQVRDKEAEIDKWDRVVNPDDYGPPTTVNGIYGKVMLDAAHAVSGEPKYVPSSQLKEGEPRCKCTHGLNSHYLCGGGDETRCLTGCGCAKFE